MTENSFDTENYKITQNTWGEIGKIKGPKNFFWFIGSFIDSPSLTKRDDFEVKYWEFKKEKSISISRNFKFYARSIILLLKEKSWVKLVIKKELYLKGGIILLFDQGK